VTHPFSSIPRTSRRAVFLPFLVLTAIVFGTAWEWGRDLVTPDAPHGMISFQLAGDQLVAQRIIASWDTDDTPSRMQVASFCLGLDFLFIVAYSTTLALGCVSASTTFRDPRWIAVGIVLAWAQALAALLDCGENTFLLLQLYGVQNPLWPPLARWFALAKFALTGLGVAYATFGPVRVRLRLAAQARPLGV